MKKLITILAGFVAAVSFFPAAAQSDFNGVTVMSFNIRYGTANDGTNSWDFRAEAVLEMIKEQKPDVMGLQEAIFAQNRLLDYFLDDYKYIGVGREDGKKEGEYMSIFYNKKTVSLLKWGTFWLSETPEKPSKGWDAQCYRTATWALFKDKKSGKKFYIFNTHLDHMGSQARTNGAELLVSKIKEINTENLPVALTGDFNSTPDSPVLTPIKAYMSNSRDVAVKSDDLDTANSWGKHFSKIDYIWFKGFSSCIEYQTINKRYLNRAYISDHFPIRSKLVF